MINLPSDVVKDFSKLVKNRSQSTEKPKTFVYGSIVEEDGALYLQLDGSSELMSPGSLAQYAEGDRVVCTIEDHHAVIMGNYTDPALNETGVQEIIEEEGLKKEATNYLSSDTSGIMVADLSDGQQTPSTATGRNVKIDNDSVDVRDGQDVLASYGEVTTLGREGMCQFHITGDELYGTSPEGKIMFSVKPGFDQPSSLKHVENSGNIAVTDNEFTYTLRNTPTSYAVDVYGFLYFDEQETSYSKTPTWSLEDDDIVAWEGAGTISYDGSIERSGNTFSIEITNVSTDVDHATFYFSYTTTYLAPLSSITFGTRSHQYTPAHGSASFGQDLISSGEYSFAEGIHNIARGEAAHVEGGGYSEEINGYTYLHHNEANGDSSHAEGRRTIAGSVAAHAEGGWTTVRGDYGHAEGHGTVVNEYAAHAEGESSEAYGRYSHAQNLQTKANGNSQTAIGRYNVADNNDEYVLIIGNGTSISNRSNALAIKWDGTPISPVISYSPNDTFSVTQLNVSGIMAVTNTTVILSLETDKYMDLVSNVTVTSLVGALRGVNGYIDGSRYDTDWITSAYTVTATKKSRKHVEIRITKANSAAFTNATTDTPVSLYATMTLTFTT